MMPTKDNQAGQAMMETAMTIFLVFFAVFVFIQIAFFAIAKLALQNAVNEAMKVAKQSANPLLVDNKLQGKLAWLEIGGRKIFSDQFAVNYYLASNPLEFEDEYMPYQTAGREWEQETANTEWSLDRNDGYLRIHARYDSPLKLLPLGQLTQISASSIGKLECEPIAHSNNYPFCIK